MSSPTAPAMDAASAVAQAIGRILLAMLDALFGDISGLAPRHPIRRAHARAQRHIERYVAALAIALATPEEAPQAEAPLTPKPRPASVIPLPRPTCAGRPSSRRPTPSPPRSAPIHHLAQCAVARPFRYDLAINPSRIAQPHPSAPTQRIKKFLLLFSKRSASFKTAAAPSPPAAARSPRGRRPFRGSSTPGSPAPPRAAAGCGAPGGGRRSRW